LKLIDKGGSPRPLGKHGRALWCSIMDEYEITDAGGIELLCLACQALDRAESCREQIDKMGECGIVDGRAVREHPLLKTELANRSFVSKCLERLGLNAEPGKAVGRPAGSWSHAKAAS
jgi:hypothetical protein